MNFKCFFSGKACEFCQRLFQWGPKPTSKDVNRGQKLLQDPAKKQVTMAYLEHLELCKNSRLGMLVYPEKGEMLKFK